MFFSCGFLYDVYIGFLLLFFIQDGFRNKDSVDFLLEKIR